MELLLLTSLFVLLQDGDQVDGEPADVRCGAYCLYVALRGLNLCSIDYADFEKTIGPPSQHGYSLSALADAAAAQGAHHAIANCSLDTLLALRQPFACIVALRDHHVVCVSDVSGDVVQILDPPDEYTINRAQFEQQWDGMALLISGVPLLLPRPGPSWFIIVGLVCGIVLLVGTAAGAIVWTRKARSKAQAVR